MSHPDSSLLLLASKQASRIESFHFMRDNGLDIYNPDDTSRQLYLIDQPDITKALADITKLLDEVLPKQRVRIGKRQETSRGQVIRMHNRNSVVIKACMQVQESQFDGYRIDPDVQAILEVNNEMGASHFANMPLNFVVHGQAVHEHYKDYLDRLKARLSTPAIKKFRCHQLVEERRRFESIQKAVDKAIQLSKRACLVRVDGCYKQSFRADVSPSVISNDLDRLIGNMRHNKSQFAPLIQAIFKIEYGASKGYHWHGFFIYDGSMTCKDVLRGKYLLDYWCNVITHGKGSGYNVNGTAAKRQLARYVNSAVEDLALGQLKKSSLAQRINLIAVCRYLAKTRQLIRISNEKRTRQLRIVRGPRFRQLLAKKQ